MRGMMLGLAATTMAFATGQPNDTGAIGLITDPAGHPLGMYSRAPIAGAK